MRVISKQISLENFTSRLPGVVPAYRERDGKVYYFDNNSLKSRDYEFPSNYGLIPMSVNTSKGCLSWERISDLYHFFTDYKHLLNDWGHCGIKYSTAVGYYANESKNGYADQMVYGTLEQTYIDLDARYNEWKSVEGTINNCVPSMTIPETYQDYWHVKKLFYPDIIKWNGWFKARSQYAGKTLAQCSATTNCCECTEYVNRGGSTMANALQSAYNSMQSVISSISVCAPAMELPVSLQVSIDDLGEFSIFSEEYKLGVDYRNASGYGATENTEGGAVVAISGNAMTLKDSVGNNTYRGFDFDPEYMELKEAPSQWKVHDGKTKDSTGHNIPEEDSETTDFQNAPVSYYYGFKSDMTKVTGSTETSVRQAIAGKYEVSPLNAVLIEGAAYNISTEEYGYYKGNSNKVFYVYREDYTDTPYTSINGKRVYADIFSNPTKSAYFYFPFFTVGTTSVTECGTSVTKPVYKSFPRTRGSDTKNFITYDGTAYVINGNTISINGNEYRWVIGTFYNEDGTYYVGKDGYVYIVNGYGQLERDTNYTYSSGYAHKVTDYDVQVYKSGSVSGMASSRLTSLRSDAVLVDDAGDPIEGRYDVRNKHNHQPPQGTVLDLLYEVGSTANMTPYEIEEECAERYGTTFYCGDMITSMKFYFINYAGEKKGERSWSESSLKTINKMMEQPPVDTDTGIVWCDIEYVLGGTWVGSKRYKNGLYIGMTYSKPSGSFNPGVTYKETVKFVRTQVQYKLARGKDGQIPVTFNSPTANTLSYPIVCYILEQNIEELKYEYDIRYDYPVAKFEMTLPPNSGWCGYGTSAEVFPVFRQEYLLGSATMQKLDVDIYIERGTNAAFEKHLKLGEVTSMEALEQYSNGYFKMMDN
jgi:hypothetical protein